MLNSVASDLRFTQLFTNSGNTPILISFIHDFICLKAKKVTVKNLPEAGKLELYKKDLK